MLKYRLWPTLAVMCWCFVGRCAAVDETDGNRPYEFGFTIDGEQHRHEKKDENGIIMGEFGFLTADGVYHVTVYATDENGNFKILSMKNLRVKPFPTSGAPQSKALPLPKPAVNPPQTVAQTPASVLGSHPPPEAAPIRACSGCSIPTSPKPAIQLTDLALVSRDDQQFPPYPENPINTRGRQFVSQGNPPGVIGHSQQNSSLHYGNQAGLAKNGQFGGVNPGDAGAHGGNIAQLGPFGKSQQPDRYGQQAGQLSQSPEHNSRQPGQFSQQPGQFRQQPARNSQQPGKLDHQNGQFGQPPSPFVQQPGQNGQQLGQFSQRPRQNTNTGQNQARPTKPMLISAQMSIVNGDTDIHKRGPAEKEGLPNGLTKDNMLQVLYTFNYTLGFHAHSEEGYTNGAKKGYYYVTGRDGVRTRIDYTADSEGFHPKISTEVLDLLSEDVPKPETEKEEKYGLKGYEFKWLYYPPSSP